MSRLLYDLLCSDQAIVNAQCHICIIGAGAAGIYLAVQLAKRGLSVILVEAGGPRCVDASQLGFEPHCPEGPYSGATKGRYFGLGGSTAQWGGLLVPHIQYDLRRAGGKDF